MRTRIVGVVLLALSLGACQTGDEYHAGREADLSNRLSAYSGVNMAEFMSRTGLLPRDYFLVDEDRVFVFDGDPITMVVPGSAGAPTIARTNACRLLVRARYEGRSGSASDWIITGTSRTGACLNLPV